MQNNIFDSNSSRELKHSLHMNAYDFTQSISKKENVESMQKP